MNAQPCYQCGRPTKQGEQWTIGGANPRVYCSRACLLKSYDEDEREAARGERLEEHVVSMRYV